VPSRCPIFVRAREIKCSAPRCSSPAPGRAYCGMQDRLGRLGAAAEKRPSLGEPKWVALLRQAATHRLSLSVLRLSDRITRQRVGSTQQLVLHGTRWGSSARVCGGLRKHAFEIHKSLGQGCVQIGDLAVQLGRGHEQFACLVDGVRQLHGRPGDRISWDGALLGQDGSGV
jgi:hypothetical protein